MRMINKLKTVNLLFLLKTGIGSALAIIIANALGLLYSPSAGIITLLTIQNTKKETLTIAVKRIVAFILATALSYLIFRGFGYTALAYGAFVSLFVALCFLLGLKDGISMNAVLMTHYLIEKHMDLSLIFNEICILFIGMGIGILLNLIMPKNVTKIQKEQLLLEEEMKNTLKSMVEILRNKDQRLDFAPLEHKVEQLLISAYEEAGNRILADTRYLVSYLEMRKLQVGVMKDIVITINQITSFPVQAEPVAEFMEHIAASFHEKNNVTGLLTILEQLKEHFRNEPLPQSREEFEKRAILYQVIKELEYFLMLKRNFILELEEKDMKIYWK
ncbi:MAG: putative rane protein [Herbinix sp.]|nr:putative rane protein [Herbinix sp.]